MGGMGFIENNKAECMQSVLINTNLLIACKDNELKDIFSSMHAYNQAKQNDIFVEGLKETDAYPADPEDGYGWEKLFSERMCRHFWKIMELKLELPDIITFMVHLEHLMVVEKRLQQLCVEK